MYEREPNECVDRLVGMIPTKSSISCNNVPTRMQFLRFRSLELRKTEARSRHEKHVVLDLILGNVGGGGSFVP